MSDDSKINEQVAYLERTALLEKKRKEVLEKELVVKDHRLDHELLRLSESEKDKEIAKTTTYGRLSDDAVEKLKQENNDYMIAAKNKMRFINEDFSNAIPFYRKNLILVGGVTGDGKSTTAANVIAGIIEEPLKTGPNRRRVLVLTNEEKTEDVYNRVLCLFKGWSYVNHDKFTDAQREFFNNSYIHLRNKITVVDNTYNGRFGVTTTLEGICSVFDNLIANKEHYDAVIIDYYQNVQQSTNDPRLNEFQVQAALAKRLDQYKNIYPAPIVVLAQVRPVDDSNTPFKIRIEGSKTISNVCTCSVELIPDKKLRKTSWIIHKSRFNEAVGSDIETGFDSGRHVVYDESFIAKINEMRARLEQQAIDKTIGMQMVAEEKTDGSDPEKTQ